MRYLKNLASTEALPGSEPWLWDTKPAQNLADDKAARTVWITNPKTVWHCYSGFEGLNENIRVTGARGGEEGNPPFSQSALIVDFDAPWTREGLVAACEKVGANLPGYLEETLSRNARLVWSFEAPIKLPGYSFARDWQLFLSEKLRVKMYLPGVDEGALKAPERYFTNSGTWLDLQQPALSTILLRGWLVEFSQKFAFKGREFGEEMPLEKVSELLRVKYPRFTEWDGDFALESMGPSFWLDGSTSPKSAIVKPGGMMTFANHASKPFYSWSDLVGVSAVDTSKAEAIGSAVSDIFFDGKLYFRRIADGSWRSFEKGDLQMHLKATCGLSPKPDKAGVSAIDRAVQYIQNHQYVGGAAPFVFRPEGSIRVNGYDYLNTSIRKPLVPAPGKAEWGPEGSFPWVSEWIDRLFEPAEQKDYFLAWLAYFYQSCLSGKPVSGQNVIIAGGTSVGKTLLNRRVIGPLVGGYAEAADYLLGVDKFGSELFDSAHWVVDDATVSSSPSTRRSFAEILKKMSANNTFRYHAKFRIPLMVEWSGRVVVTCNADEESIRILPSLAGSILDKLCLFRTAEKMPAGFFPDRATIEDRIDRELPAFARWLADYKIPAHLWAEDRRFGVIPYHHEALVSSANHSSPVNAFNEILTDWRERYFSATNSEDFWEGTGYQLHRLLHAEPDATASLRNVTVESVGQSLSILKNRGNRAISCREDSELRVWRIERPEAKVVEEKVVLKSGTKFGKKK